eukprot:4757415-Pleurochrysis_carterae.AAC.1
MCWTCFSALRKTCFFAHKDESGWSFECKVTKRSRWDIGAEGSRTQVPSVAKQTLLPWLKR